ncbi:MAG: glycosyltransferase family 2 protein [Paramuribaculum sp.]|nr:glycosyltransferase family 2 protein [Paramuribaculum sp.]
MTTALLISTYNSPDFLRLCLGSVLNQSVMPNEILIADDGSTKQTALVVEEFSSMTSVCVKHIWHEDCGFRLAAIRNKAIAEAEADYIIQIDGDIILHPKFVADHVKFARRGSFVTGSRTLLSEQTTAELLALAPWSSLPRLKGGCRLPLITPMMANLRSGDGMYVRGCHMAFWRDDLLAVNGYNEDITGWGREDSEISFRLINSGVRKRFIKFSALEYHLHHPEASRAMDAANIAIMERAQSGGMTRVPNGIIHES